MMLVDRHGIGHGALFFISKIGWSVGTALGLTVCILGQEVMGCRDSIRLCALVGPVTTDTVHDAAVQLMCPNGASRGQGRPVGDDSVQPPHLAWLLCGPGVFPLRVQLSSFYVELCFGGIVFW